MYTNDDIHGKPLHMQRHDPFEPKVTLQSFEFYLVNRGASKVYNLFKPFEISNYNLFVIFFGFVHRQTTNKGLLPYYQSHVDNK